MEEAGATDIEGKAAGVAATEFQKMNGAEPG